jgi:hypothetical protein
LSLCDLIFSGVFERHPRLTLAIVEFELAWAPNVLSSMDYTYRERHGEAIYRFRASPREGGGPHAASDFFRRNVVSSFQEDAIGIRLRDVIGPDNMMWDNMMWGSDYPQQRVDVSPIAEDPGGDSGRGSGRRTGQACPGPRSGDRRRQHRPRVPF